MTSTAAPRVVFFVDGFNLYHSIKSAEQRFDGIPLKWLDLPALCDSTLQLIGGGARRTAVHYFTAFEELHRISPQSFKLSKESYRKHQFPHTLRLPSGKHIHIRPEWSH